jgi:hypothetical protein
MSIAIDYQISNPAGARGLRFRDIYSSDPTVALTLHSIVPINQSTGCHGTYAWQPSGQFTVYSFRDALRSFVYFAANPTSRAYQYNAAFYNDQATPASVTGSATLRPQFQQGVDFAYFSTQTLAAWTPHGNILYPGVLGESKFVWLDIAAAITFTLTSADATNELAVYIFDGDARQPAAAVVFSATGGTTATFTAIEPGYYTFAISNTSGTANTYSAQINGTGDVWAHQSMPFVDNHLVDFNRVRVLAVSALVSNCASALNREGIVYAAQLPGAKLWFQNQSITNISNARTAFVAPLEKGVYGYLKPSGSDDFAYQTAAMTENGIVSSTGYRLDMGYSYLAYTMTTSQVGTVWPGIDLVLTVSVALEMVTDDQFFEAHVSEFSVVQFQTAMEKLSVMEQFHENPSHESWIQSNLKMGLSWLNNNGQKYADMIGTILHGRTFAPKAALKAAPLYKAPAPSVRKQMAKSVPPALRARQQPKPVPKQRWVLKTPQPAAGGRATKLIAAAAKVLKKGKR